MSDILSSSLGGSNCSSLHIEEHKTDSDEGYAGYRYDDDEDWPESQRTVMDIGPLHINTGDLGRDALEIPSPTFPCVGSTTTLDLDQHCGDVRDPYAHAGISGLCNLGNTCFMNSGLQCLLSNDRLVKYFIEEFKLNTDDVAKHTLAGSFSRLLHKFWQGGFSCIHPGDFKNCVGMDHSQFSDHRQHDCQEFLALLLDSFHEYLNHQEVVKPNNAYVSENSLPHSASCEQPDFGNLHLDSDHSFPQSESTQASANCEENIENAATSKRVFDFSEIRDKVVGSDSSRDAIGSSQTHGLIETPEKSNASFVGDDSMDVEAENFSRKIPSIDDFCSKDTKTLNTNVLVANDDVGDVLATDSTKFHKQDNSVIAAGEEDGEDGTASTVLHGDQLHELYMAACTKKPIKETNLVTNCHEKFADNEKLLLSSSIWEHNSLNMQDKEKECFSADGLKRFFGSEPFELPCFTCKKHSEDEDEEKPESINNIKRIKIDEMAAEKNMRMQAKLKVNVEQNHTRSAVQLQLNNPCGIPGFGDQLCSSSSLSTAPMSSASDGVAGGPLQPESVVPSSVCSTVEGLLQMHYVRSAERAWQTYTTRNQSIIVNTFQGQFKSTVVCSECRHVSVTFEPFMYLSVPLPHALERQISIIFLPCDSKLPIRYLVSVHRLNLVRHLRAELMRMIGEDESCDLVIAEVLDHHVARILEDSMQVKMVNDTDRKIYAFEMLPMPVLENISEKAATDDDSHLQLSKLDGASANNATKSAASSASYSNCSSIPATLEVLDDVASLLMCPTQAAAAPFECSVLNNSVGSEFIVTQLESNPVIDYQHNVLNELSVMNTDTVVGEPAWFPRNLDPQLSSVSTWSEEAPVASCSTEADCWPHYGVTNNWDKTLDGGIAVSHGNLELVRNCGGNGVRSENNCSIGVACVDEEEDLTCFPVADQWKSCVICLEEMADSELKAHASCGGTLCNNCLEMSTKHLGGPFSKCPVCTAPVSSDDDFIPLSCMENYKPKTRILSVPVVNRYVVFESSSSTSSGKESVKLFGHPNVMYLPNKMTGLFLYETVDRVVPLLTSYSIVLTNGQGLRCSRCMYTQHCTGCELPRDAAEITLLPGDHLAVQFGDLCAEMMDAASRFDDHKSMESLRPDATMTLYDCFRAFTESEVLDEHNPWFCPRCHKNQCASKTMSVWRYPDTLIVYLKRFVYHELSSTKIDSKVLFPLEDLDLSDYISGPSSSDLVYDLQSCVLHFGGVNSGHYTAYARHPVHNEWLYTNDETVLKQPPSESDSCHVYILFYQRRGTQVTFSLPSLSDFDMGEGVGVTADDVVVEVIQSTDKAGSSKSNLPFLECSQDNIADGKDNEDITETFDFYT